MASIDKLLLLSVLFLSFTPSARAGSSLQFGVAYGRDIRSEAHLEQYELFLRKPLSYKTTIGGSEVATAMEFGLGLVREWDAGGFGTARFLIMPEAIFRPRRRFSFLFGLGAGIMAGGTEFSRHDLGGPLLFAAKLGIQLHLNEHWGLEYTFSHQSNASIYTHNYSLDMNQLAFTYTF
jgi:Lipid A 3-O-deacylase (PagL)